MKRLLHFLARLYPRSWRERYGTEFAALLDDARPRWFDIFDLLKGGLAMRVMRSRISVMAAIFALAGGMAALGVSYAMPKTWLSRAAIDVVVLDGVRHQDAVNSLVGYVGGYVLADDFLTQLVGRYGLYPNVSTPVQRLRKSVMIRPARQNEIEISFAYPDEKMAKVVTDQIVSRFIDGNVQTAVEDAREGRPDLAARSMRLMLAAPAATALLRINPLPAASAGLAGGLVLGILAGWALRRWRAGRSAATPRQG
ncbi:MAG TPA: hypothetical protein VIY49_04930 [Bryobacteraceae bacterium]